MHEYSVHTSECEFYMKYFNCNAIMSKEESVRLSDTTGRLPGLPSLVFSLLIIHFQDFEHQMKVQLFLGCIVLLFKY